MIRNAVKKKLRQAATGSAPEEHIPEKDGMIFAHIAFRREALRHLDPSVEWQQRSLWRWWRQWGSMVHHHHDIEEEILFPWLRTKVDLPPEVSTDHEKLLQQMEEISSFQDRFDSAKSDEDKAAVLQQLQTLFAEFREFMRAHLDLEDGSITHELLCQHFSYEEYAANTQEIALKGGVFNAAKTTRDMLAWFEQGMTEEEAREFYREELPKHIPMPRLVEYSNRLRWKDRYFQRHVALLESVIQGTKRPSKKAAKERRMRQLEEEKEDSDSRLLEDFETADGESDEWEIPEDDDERDCESESESERQSENEKKGVTEMQTYSAGDGKEVLWECKKVVGVLAWSHSHTLPEGGDNLSLTIDASGMGVKGKRRFLCVQVSFSSAGTEVAESLRVEVGSGGRPPAASLALPSLPAGVVVKVRARSRLGPIRVSFFLERNL